MSQNRTWLGRSFFCPRQDKDSQKRTQAHPQTPHLLAPSRGISLAPVSRHADHLAGCPLRLAHASQEPRVHSCCIADSDARHRFQCRHFQRGERGALARAAIPRSGPAGDGLGRRFEKRVPSQHAIDWKADRKTFDDVAALATGISNLTGNGEPEQLEREQATYNLFGVLGVQPVLGRVFTAEEDKPGGGRVMLISHGLWKRRFGGDPRVIGQAVSLDGANYTVIGVMPEGFSFPYKGTDFWLPIAFTAETLASRGNHYLLVVARLRPGVSLSQANADLQVLLKSLSQVPGHLWLYRPLLR